MQNQYFGQNNLEPSNDLNHSNNQNENNESDKSTKYYVIGLVTGIAVALSVVLLGFSGVKFYQNIVKPYREVKQSAESTKPESVVNDSAERKLAVLEKTIQKYFWQEVDEETLEDGLYKGLLEALDDPYSEYYTKEELLELQADTEGIYYGIGAYISEDVEAGYVQISGIMKGSPAEESDLMQDDYIYKVDGEDMQGQESSYVVSKIKGEEGTFVTLTVIREGAAQPLDIKVERRRIESPTVEYEMLDNDMAYIQIVEFDLVTTGQFEEAYSQAKADGMKGLIIDLRSNPGGNLSTVCDIARMILPKGLIVYTEDKYGKREEYTCNGENRIEVPLVVLTNGYSASASEILAGAVKDYGIGKLVGTTTFGKGIVQKVIDLTDGSAIKLTVSSYFTPSGKNIHGIGIEPDVEVEFDADLYQQDIDNQLEKAKEVLADMME